MVRPLGTVAWLDLSSARPPRLLKHYTIVLNTLGKHSVTQELISSYSLDQEGFHYNG